jgi:two-component system cell cycle response regulator DivK
MAAQAPKIRVALVEDDFQVRDGLRLLIDQAKTCICVAAYGSAEEALARLATDNPDVVLMDIQLPDLDGESVLRRLRSQPSTADIPVVALTAFAMRDDRQRFLNAGFDGYLEKPIDIRTLAVQVRLHCR